MLLTDLKRLLIAIALFAAVQPFFHSPAKAQVTVVTKGGEANSLAFLGEFDPDAPNAGGLTGQQVRNELPSVLTGTFDATSVAQATGGGGANARSRVTGSYGITNLAEGQISSISVTHTSTGSLSSSVGSYGSTSNYDVELFIADTTPYTLTGTGSRSGLGQASLSSVTSPFPVINLQFNPLNPRDSEVANFTENGTLERGTFRLSSRAGSGFADGGPSAGSGNLSYNLVFGDPANEFTWDGFNGDWDLPGNWNPARVPESGDTAKFLTPETYSINVGQQEIEQLQLGGGVGANPTFNNLDLTVQATSLTDPGVSVNGGTFTFGSGSLSNTNATIGRSTLTTVNVSDGMTWNNQGQLTVGTGGETSLNVNGKLESATVIVGDATNGAAATVNVANGGVWEVASSLGIGRDSNGTVNVLDSELIVRDLGSLDSAVMEIGGATGGSGNDGVGVLNIIGDAPAPIEFGLSGDLTVGVNAKGTLKVADGAFALISGSATFAKNAEADLVVESGAQLSVQQAVVLGETRQASAVVDGQGSSLSAATELDVMNATLEAKNGGTVRVGEELFVGPSGTVDTRSGAVTVGIAGAETGKLKVGIGGVVEGVGTLRGTFENVGGEVRPGASPGQLTIDGDFVQGEEGATFFEIGGLLAGEEYDQLIVTGDALVDGSFFIDFIDGFAPSEGDSFDLMPVFGSTDVIGTVPVEVRGLEDGFEFDFGQNDAGGLIFIANNDGVYAGSIGGDPLDPNAVPEPSSLVVWLMLGLCVVGGSRLSSRAT